jgi:hypothetical protein
MEECKAIGMQSSRVPAESEQRISISVIPQSTVQYQNAYFEGRETESDPANDTPAPANARPLRTVSVWTDTDASAIIVPTKLLEYPRVALDETCQ